MITKKTATKKAARKADTRPTMSRLEVEQRVANAGHEAVQKASKAGASKRTLKALSAAGESVVEIAGFRIGPATLNSMVALDRYWQSDLAKKASAVMALVHTVFAYLRPDEALASLDISEAEFERTAQELSKQIPMAQMSVLAGRIKAHITDLFSTANGGEAEEAEPGERRRS